MEIRNTLNVWGILPLCLLGACDRNRAEQREEALEERAEQREELREEANEPNIQANEPETRVGTNEPSTNAATAAKGLQAATVKQITEARCAREQKCGNIGPDNDHASVEACQQKVGEDWADEINAYDCPGGVVQKELSECLVEIKDESCDSPFDTLGRVVACRSSDLCKAID